MNVHASLASTPTKKEEHGVQLHVCIVLACYNLEVMSSFPTEGSHHMLLPNCDYAVWKALLHPGQCVLN